MQIVEEFKKFISQGNALNLAIGVIIGNAFNKIVTSLVNDLLMPIIGIFLGKIDLRHLAITFKSSNPLIGGVSIYYGRLIQNIFDFLIVSFVIFFIIKVINAANSDLLNQEKKGDPHLETLQAIDQKLSLLLQEKQSPINPEKNKTTTP